MSVTYSELITFPFIGIQNISVYRDGEFIGNLTRDTDDSPWHTTKHITDSPVYFERLDDAKAFIESHHQSANDFGSPPP